MVLPREALGLCIGVPLSLIAGSYLAHQLYGVGRFDPVVIGSNAPALGDAVEQRKVRVGVRA